MDGINPRFTPKTSLPSELFLLPLHAIAAVLKSHRDYIAPQFFLLKPVTSALQYDSATSPCALHWLPLAPWDTMDAAFLSQPLPCQPLPPLTTSLKHSGPETILSWPLSK